jgi:hypothetical protein
VRGSTIYEGERERERESEREREERKEGIKVLYISALPPSAKNMSISITSQHRDKGRGGEE